MQKVKTMDIEKFKYKLYGIVLLILFFLTMYLLYWSDKYLREKDTVPMTEEEKELIEDDSPEGVPTRFWN